LKKFVVISMFLIFGFRSNAQKFQLKLNGNDSIETKTIDSLFYIKTHKNLKSIDEEVVLTSKKLSQLGFIENKIVDNQKINDSVFTAKIILGQKIKFVHINLKNNTILKELLFLDKSKDTLILLYPEIESFLDQKVNQLEKKGFSLAKLKLINIRKKKQIIYADLELETNKKRKLNAVVIKYLDEKQRSSFPKGYLAQINRKFRNRTFNQSIVKDIHDDFDKFGFVNQIKYPEILFTKDTTQVYVYLEKKKSNTFDGFVGFSNGQNNKVIFNGYLDVTLENTLRAGEQFSLYWKSDGKNQKTFKTGIEVPYLFKSPLGIKAQINIFKQDSTFQNTKTNLDLGYFINYNTRVYVGYQTTESSDIQNANTSKLRDYKNDFVTTSLEYMKFDPDNFMFSKKTSLMLTLGAGKRASNSLLEITPSSNQNYINLNLMNNFYFNKKNDFNLRFQSFFLQSNSYIINELYRFGGTNSIRGFAENSLQASSVALILTEYRYFLTSKLCLHSILDYSLYIDQTIEKLTKKTEELLGIGLGIKLQTKNGLFNFAIANGSAKNQKAQFSNTIIHICYNVKF
jgi:hypothetical protein